MKQSSKPILKLRLYRGSEMNYTRDGVVKNENNLCSLEYNTRQWSIFMSTIAFSGYCKVEVESGHLPDGEGGYNEINDLSKYQEEVQSHFEPRTTEVNENSELERLRAELEEMKSLIKGGKVAEEEPKKPVKVAEEDSSNEELEQLRNQYFDLYNKKPFNGWKAHKLKDMINEKKAELKTQE